MQGKLNEVESCKLRNLIFNKNLILCYINKNLKSEMLNNTQLLSKKTVNKAMARQ